MELSDFTKFEKLLTKLKVSIILYNLGLHFLKEFSKINYPEWRKKF
jgi:hypothetical protein